MRCDVMNSCDSANFSSTAIHVEYRQSQLCDMHTCFNNWQIIKCVVNRWYRDFLFFPFFLTETKATLRNSLFSVWFFLPLVPFVLHAYTCLQIYIDSLQIFTYDIYLNFYFFNQTKIPFISSIYSLLRLLSLHQL